MEARVVTGEDGRPVEGADVWLYAYDWGQGRRHHRVEAQTFGRRAAWCASTTRAGRSERSYFLLARRGADYALDPSYLSLAAAARAGRGDGARSSTPTAASTGRSRRCSGRSSRTAAARELGRLRASPQAAGDRDAARRQQPGGRVEDRRRPTRSARRRASSRSRPAARSGAGASRARLPGSAAVRVEEYKRPTFEVQLEGPGDGAAAEPAGGARGRGALLLRPAGRERQRALARDARRPSIPWWWWWWHARRGGRRRRAGRSRRARRRSRPTARSASASRRRPTSALGQGRRGDHLPLRGASPTSPTRAARRGRTSAASGSGFVSVEASVDAGAGFLRESAPGGAHDACAPTSTACRAPARAAGACSSSSQPPTARCCPAELPPQRPRAADGIAVSRRRATACARAGTRGSRRSGCCAAGPTARERAHGELVARREGRGAARRCRAARRARGACATRRATRSARRTRRTTDFLVAGRKTPLALPARAHRRAALGAGRRDGALLVGSGLPGQTLFLEILRDGRRRRAPRALDAAAPALIELPVAEDDRGGFAVALSLVRDHQFVQPTQSRLRAVGRQGARVEFATFRDRLRPGTKETWRVTVRAPTARGRPRPAAAELLAYMYDRSLDAFAPHSPPIAARLYPNRTSAG